MDIWPCSVSAHAAEKTLSPRLLLQHSVHVEQSITSVCECVGVLACVRVYKLCTFLCVVRPVWEAVASQTKKKNMRKLKRKRAHFQEEAPRATRRDKKTKLEEPEFPSLASFRLDFSLLQSFPSWCTIGPHLHLQGLADVRA